MTTMAADNRRMQMALSLLLAVFAIFLLMSILSYNTHDPPNCDFPRNSIVKNFGGLAGAYVSWLALSYLGFAAYVVILLTCFWVYQLSRGLLRQRWLKLAAGITTILVVSVLMGIQRRGVFSTSELPSPGGLTGAYGSVLLVRLFAVPGTYLLLLTVGGIALLLASDMLLYDAGVALWRGVRTHLAWEKVRKLLPRVRRKPSQFKVRTVMPARRESEPERAAPVEAAISGAAEVQEEPVRTKAFTPERVSVTPGSGYELPDVELLDEMLEVDTTQHEQLIQEKAHVLERCLHQFGVGVAVVGVDAGPVITQYELELTPGIKVGKVMALHDDIAMALKAPSVRIVAPIPGRGTVGVEVPNTDKNIVQIREMFTMATAQTGKCDLPLYLGKDASGHPLVADLAELPHLLIAGCTGSGKSVCINTIIIGLLMTKAPDEVKLLLVDPKMVEMSAFKTLPHLLSPVVTDMQKAIAMLAWAEEKMDERYDLLARVGVRSLSRYNALSKAKLQTISAQDDEQDAPLPEQLPHIIIIIDELADLMLQSGRGEAETSITRLAQKSRAVGIHLILATQRPSVDVITGLIKSNLPARLSFQVASKVDSRTVLDRNGAEKLLGRGDMLYLSPRTGKLIRAQGTFTSDNEIRRIVDFVSQQANPEFSRELVYRRTPRTGSKKKNASGYSDELYEESVRIVLEAQRGSVSLLQRRLEIGYGRAARLIDMMAADGIVGDYKGSQAREVLLALEEWEEGRQQGGEN